MFKALVAVVVVTLAMVFMAGYYLFKEGHEWREFAAQHHCLEIGKRPGVPVAVYHKIGNVMYPQMIQTLETGYRCDDGKEYWR